MSIIHWWMGTDVLKLVKVPPGKFTWRFRIYGERLLWKMMEPIITEHWVVAEHLANSLVKFGIKRSKIKVVPDSVKYGKYRKRKHKGFNVLYYCPKVRTNQKFKDWLYGKDIYEELRRRIPDINWIVVDGQQNMARIFPVVDAYIRPNRHDGNSRLVMECKRNKIPVLATIENPDVDTFERWIRCIKS